MIMNRISVFAAAMLVIVGIVFWTYKSEIKAPFLPITAESTAEGRISVHEHERKSLPPVSKDAASWPPQDQASGSIFEQVSNSIAAAKGGDPTSARIVYQGYEACWQYAMNPNGFLSAEQAQDPNPQIRNMQQARAQLIKRCRGFEGMQIGPKAIAEMRKIAAAGGDLTALADIAIQEEAMGKIDPNEIKNLAESTISKNDASAMVALSAIMGALTEPYIDQLSPLPAGDNLSEAAWMIAACNSGYDCSAGGLRAQSMCAYGGINCQLTDIPSFYSQQILTAAELEQLQKEVGKINHGQS